MSSQRCRSRVAGTAVRQNNTQISESLKQQLYEQKRRPVDDLLFIPHNFFFFLLLSQLPSVYKAGWAHVFYLITTVSFSNLRLFIASLPLSMGGFWLEAVQRCVNDQLSVQLLPLWSYIMALETSVHCSSFVSAQSLLLTKKNKKLDFHLLLLQGFYRGSKNRGWINFSAATFSIDDRGTVFYLLLNLKAPASCLCVMHLLTALQHGSSSV